MTVAVIFLLLSLFFLAALIYYLDILIFYQKEKANFCNAKKGEVYWEYLRNRGKKMRGKRKKNVLMHLHYQSYLICGEREKAAQIFPFLKKDILFGLDGK